jgi:hypothetical protein
MMRWVSKRIGTAYNSQSDYDSQSCHETHRFSSGWEEASLAETTVSPPRRPESCAEARFAVATRARKRKMAVLVMV